MDTPILILAAIATCAVLYPLAVYRDHFGWLGGGMALSFAVHCYFRWLKSAARNP